MDLLGIQAEEDVLIARSYKPSSGSNMQEIL